MIKSIARKRSVYNLNAVPAFRVNVVVRFCGLAFWVEQ